MHELESHYLRLSKSREMGGKDFAYLMVHGNEVIKSKGLEGLDIKCSSILEGINLEFLLSKGYVIKKPVMICFGLLSEEGTQRINVRGKLEEGSSMEFIAYCIFPNGKKVKHYMQGNIEIGERASFKYTETHYHGEKGGVEIYPAMNVTIQKRGYFYGNFSLSEGRAGIIDLNYKIDAREESNTELFAKTLASGTDRVHFSETISLNEKNARGIMSSHLVGKDSSIIEVNASIIAKSEGCRGHVECIETILGDAKAIAIPVVNVQHPLAHVTHEAAVGSINKQQLDVLLSKGLSVEKATDLLVRGLLR